MTRPAVTYPDVERVVVDFLTGQLDDATVGTALPDGWGSSSPPHLQVACDGTPIIRHPIVAWPTVRLVAWHPDSPTAAKELVHLAHGLVLAHVGPEFSATALTGLLPARDPDHHAELASVTVRVAIRSTPIT